MEKLSQKAIDAFQPTATSYIKFDASAPGFGVRVLPNGVKSFIFRYRMLGQVKQVTLGRVGFMRLDDARDRARKLYTMKQEGVDPLAESKTKAKTMTFTELYNAFIKVNGSKLAATTLKNFKQLHDKYMAGTIGSLPIGSPVITERITGLHASLSDKPAAANQMARKTHRIFEFAVKMRWLKENPILVEYHREAGKNATMSTDEAALLFEHAGKWAERHRQLKTSKWWKVGYALQFMIVTGCRKGEVLKHLRWDFIDKDTICWPAEVIKQRKELVVVITPLVQEILDKMPRDTPLVFGYDRGVPSGTDMEICDAIQAEAGFTKNYRIHDIRHTFASIAGNEADLDLKDTGLLMGHGRATTTERYRKFFDKKKKTVAATMGETFSTIIGGSASGSSQTDDQDGRQGGQ